jgi:cell division septum initiation protein DivIVA
MAGTIEELLDVLYAEIEEAKNMPLNPDKCVVDRDRVLDMIDDVKAELPVELKRARDLVANKNDYIASTKREADSMRKQAEDYARRLVDENTITRQAQERADEIIAEAEDTCRMLKNAASEYCEDTLRRMEEAVADAYDEVKRSRANFRSALGAANPPSQSGSSSNRRPMYDAEEDD